MTKFKFDNFRIIVWESKKKELSLDVILVRSYKMYYKEENGESSHI